MTHHYDVRITSKVSRLEFASVADPTFLRRRSGANQDDGDADADAEVDAVDASLLMPAVPHAIMEKEFAYIDKDRDNEVSLVEMAGFVRTRSHVLVAIAIDRLFQAVDHDGDGVLSVDEVATSYAVLSPLASESEQPKKKQPTEKKGANKDIGRDKDAGTGTGTGTDAGTGTDHQGERDTEREAVEEYMHHEL